MSTFGDLRAAAMRLSVLVERREAVEHDIAEAIGDLHRATGGTGDGPTASYRAATTASTALARELVREALATAGLGDPWQGFQPET